MYIHIYIYIYIYSLFADVILQWVSTPRSRTFGELAQSRTMLMRRENPSEPGNPTENWVALLVQCCLSNPASFVLRAFRRVKDQDHHNLLYYSPLLKNTCIRQVSHNHNTSNSVNNDDTNMNNNNTNYNNDNNSNNNCHGKKTKAGQG